MIKKTYQFPKSSFLAVEKDMNLIVEKMFKNDNLKKLLFYTSRDCLSKPNLSDDETVGLFGNQIKLVPKLQVDNEIKNYIIISFDNFIDNKNNPEFRDNILEFDVICHFDQWHLTDFQLRPYRIAAEIDAMFNERHLSGIGTLQFLGANQMILTDEYAGLCLMYAAIHGEEDKKGTLNPDDEKELAENFNKIFS